MVELYVAETTLEKTAKAIEKAYDAHYAAVEEYIKAYLIDLSKYYNNRLIEYSDSMGQCSVRIEKRKSLYRFDQHIFYYPEEYDNKRIKIFFETLYKYNEELGNSFTGGLYIKAKNGQILT